MIKDGHNGLLIDFFSPTEIADQIDAVLDHPDRMAHLRASARETIVQRYSLKSCLAQQVKLIKNWLITTRISPAHENPAGSPADSPKRRQAGRVWKVVADTDDLMRTFLPHRCTTSGKHQTIRHDLAPAGIDTIHR